MQSAIHGSSQTKHLGNQHATRCNHPRKGFPPWKQIESGHLLLPKFLVMLVLVYMLKFLARVVLDRFVIKFCNLRHEGLGNNGQRKRFLPGNHMLHNHHSGGAAASRTPSLAWVCLRWKGTNLEVNPAVNVSRRNMPMELACSIDLLKCILGCLCVQLSLWTWITWHPKHLNVCFVVTAFIIYTELNNTPFCSSFHLFSFTGCIGCC